MMFSLSHWCYEPAPLYSWHPTLQQSQDPHSRSPDKGEGSGDDQEGRKTNLCSTYSTFLFYNIFSNVFCVIGWIFSTYSELQNYKTKKRALTTHWHYATSVAHKPKCTHWHVPWSFRFLNEFFSTFLITIDLKSFCRICTLPLWVDVCISIITGCTSSCLHLPTMWILKLSGQTSTWQEVRRRLLSPLSLFTSLRVQSSSRYSAKVTGSITAGKRRLRNTPHLSAFGCFLWQAIGFECSAEHQWRQMER